MSKLFVELYLDEDVDVLVAELLKKRGYSAITARDAGTLGQEDHAQLAHAVQEQRALLTHNRIDFERGWDWSILSVQKTTLALSSQRDDLHTNWSTGYFNCSMK